MHDAPEILIKGFASRHLVFLHSLFLMIISFDSSSSDVRLSNTPRNFHVSHSFIWLYVLDRRTTVKSHNIGAHTRSCRHVFSLLFSVFLPFLACNESSSRRSKVSSRLILLVNIKLHMSIQCTPANFASQQHACVRAKILKDVFVPRKEKLWEIESLFFCSRKIMAMTEFD